MLNSLVIVVISLVLFFWAYKVYARKLESLWEVNPSNSTPAHTKFDNVDYIPAKNWLVLFGHHFASISGAGPILGPIIAVMVWGWAPTVLWIILGTIFIGGVHDFGSLITSVRQGGSSIADIAEAAISRRAKIVFSCFLLLSLILVIAVFAYFCANTFINKPEVVVPSLGLIPVAMLVGYLLYYLRINPIYATLLGLVMMAGLIFLGNLFPLNASLGFWIFILFIYSYIASIIPVNILLQPRDYLSSYLLFFGVIAGYLGLIITRPVITMPAYITWKADEGYLWPALFVTVACGAISGFHTLISSGTSSKQLPNEYYAKRIGYGGMVAEAIVAILAVICVGILFKSGENFTQILKDSSPIGLFGKGYGAITQIFLGGFGVFIAITILNAFILTTLDTATRIGRYITEELFKVKNRFLSTLLIIIPSVILAVSGKWNKIWPAFGASNQLVAALAFLVITCWLLSRNKPVRYTLAPAALMLITTIAALIMQIARYFKHGDYLLLSISISLLLLALFMMTDVISVFKKVRLKWRRN
ncbi:MAG: carbon starvation protein A [Candidatus Omnitrophota bacterium]|nr:MAG: carbon starvation protein A [Candidatus Omnitrophota bacterium]